jgi:L-ascorbate metabolism protein UlaG (beta-lactamase superfamily)
MSVLITATGNAGVHVAAPGASVYVDAFWGPVPRIFGGHKAAPPARLPADGILVTHAHWDHFDADRLAEAAARTGAKVVGSEDVIRQLRGLVPEGALVMLEPRGAAKGATAVPVETGIGAARIAAFRTDHSRGHNSYLVRAGGFSFFHDGDSEQTRPLDVAKLAPVDALFLCPWQGSGWAEFVERLQPRKWFLIHLSEEEIAEHRAGRFLTDLCDRVPLPDRTVALAPGETYSFP